MNCPNCGHDLGSPWPAGVFEVALDVLGPGVQNEGGRTRKTLDKKIAHCMEQWEKRYGSPLNAEQEQYASSILCHAFREGKRDAGGAPTIYPFIYGSIDRLRNHEKVHEGFKRRMQLVSVADILDAA